MQQGFTTVGIKFSGLRSCINCITSIYLELHLLERDKIKLRKIIREHDHANTVKKKDTDHTNIIKELEKRFKDIVKHIEFGLHIGCKEGDWKPSEKKEGGREDKKRKKNKVNYAIIDLMVA